MDNIHYFFIAVIIMLLWLNILATASVYRDTTIEKTQCKYQAIFIWLFPFIGALVFLHLVHKHSPEAISTSLIPWPFKKMISVQCVRSNQNCDDSDHAIDLAITNHHDYSSGIDCSGHD